MIFLKKIETNSKLDRFVAKFRSKPFFFDEMSRRPIVRPPKSIFFVSANDCSEAQKLDFLPGLVCSAQPATAAVPGFA